MGRRFRFWHRTGVVAGSHFIARPLAFITGCLSLATLLAYGGRWSWACELLVNFRTHYAGFLGLALILAAATRHWRIAGIALVALALNLWPMLAVPATPAVQPQDARRLRVVAFNVLIRNDDMPRVARYLESLAPDVVILEELPRHNAEPLFALLAKSLPHQFHTTELSAGGLGILSRHPLLDSAIVSRDGVMLAARTDVDLGDHRLRLYGIHLHWPLVPASAAYRNAQLRALARELVECTGACMAAGDFNTTPWSNHFRDLLDASGFWDCSRGQGWVPTWPAQLPAPLRIRIDQCLVRGPVGIERVSVGGGEGSDHLATINDLRVGLAPRK